MRATGGGQGCKKACGENPKSWGADDDNEGPTSRQGVVTYMRQQFLNARRYKRAVEQARAGKGALPPRDLQLEALAGILSGVIRVNVHCYRARDIAAVLHIDRAFGFRVGAIHHATEAYTIPGLLSAPR